jgi:hypothetical protein
LWSRRTPGRKDIHRHASFYNGQARYGLEPAGDGNGDDRAWSRCCH